MNPLQFTQRVLTCSGPGAAEAIGTAELVSIGCALVSLVLTVVVGVRAFQVRKKSLWLAFAVAALLVALYPPITASVVRGDCGASARLYAMVVAALHLGLAALAISAKKPVVA